MAEQSSFKDESRRESDNPRSNDVRGADHDCSICLQPYNLPVEVGCGHVFCFLCIKGVAMRNSSCPLCRQQIATEYFQEPKLRFDKRRYLATEECGSGKLQAEVENGAEPETETETETDTEQKTLWYYEGLNGWWRYDETTQLALEVAYRNDKSGQIELLIAGFIYTIDFSQMFQQRKDAPSRRRRVRRDVGERVDGDDAIDALVVKGIAGLSLSNENGQKMQQR